VKKQKYKILLVIGLIPFIINLISSLFVVKNGFQIFDLLPEYGLKAFIHQFMLNTVFGSPIFIIALILIIFSIYKIRKVEKNEK